MLRVLQVEDTLYFEHLPLPTATTTFTSQQLKHSYYMIMPQKYVHFCRYPRAQAHPRLAEELVATYSPLFQREILPTETIVTTGAYQGIHWTFEAFVQAGDEVIVFDPLFDAYIADSIITGAKYVSVPLMLEVSKIS